MSSTDLCEQSEGRSAAPERSATHVQRLVRAAAQEKERAWGALVDEFKALVARIAVAHRLDEVDAAEVARTTWVLMFEHLGDSPEPGGLGTWLTSTARQECLRLLWTAPDGDGRNPAHPARPPGWIDRLEETANGSPAALSGDRFLTTVLFTDIVGSTECAVELGDHHWRQVLDTHNAVVRRELARWQGKEMKTTGDGFLATFECPARAVCCAAAITDAVGALGLRVRTGVHTGECEPLRDGLGGIAVHIGARIASLACGQEVLVSSTVTDLVCGSGLRFVDRGAHPLKGIPNEWHLYALQR
jgi:class 3 adenylate cyclase